MRDSGLLFSFPSFQFSDTTYSPLVRYLHTMAFAPPSIFSLPHEHLPSNSHPTPTLAEQLETEDLLESLLSITAPLDAPQNPTTLRRGEHNVFLGSSLFKLPGGYVALDASKPWLMFWSLQSLDILGISLDDELKRR